MVGPNGVLITICRIWNDGDATAHNVRLSVEAEGVVCNLKYWEHWHEYEPGRGKHGFEVPLEPVDYGWTSLSTKEMYPTAWTDEQRRYPNHEMQGVFTREKGAPPDREDPLPRQMAPGFIKGPGPLGHANDGWMLTLHSRQQHEEPLRPEIR